MISRETISAILLRASKLSLFLLLFTPLVVTPFTFFPFAFGKALFFKLVTEITLGFYLLLIFLRPEFRPRFSVFTAIILGFILILTIAAFAGVDRAHSIWGNIERSEGLILWWHLGVFLVILTALFRTYEDWFRFFQVSILVSLISGIVGLLEKVGVSLPHLSAPQFDVLIGLAGNPAFFASYLLFHIFFALILFFATDPRDREHRTLYGLIAVFLSISVFWTAARTTILGLCAGIGTFSLFFVIAKNDKRIRIVMLTLVFTLLFGYLGLLFQHDTLWVRDNALFNKFTNIEQISISFEQRSVAWRAAIAAWKDRPLFGWGPENFELAFYKHFDPEYPYTQGRGNFFMHDTPGFDRAHSVPLDILATSGIVGLLAFLGIFMTFGGALVTTFLRHRNTHQFFSILNPICMGLLVAYLVQDLFIFDTLNTYLPLFVFFGFLGFHLRASAVNPESTQRARFTRPILLPIFACAILIIISGLVYFINVRPTLASMYGRNAFLQTTAGRYDDAFALFEKNFALGTYVSENTTIALTHLMVSSRFPREEFIRFFDLAEREVLRAQDHHPLNVRYRVSLARIYMRRGILFGEHDAFARAESVLKDAVYMSPRKIELYYDLGLTRIFQGDLEGARGYFEEARELHTRFPKSYWFLAVHAILAGDQESAKRNIAEGLFYSKDFTSAPSAMWLNVVYRRFDEYPKQLEILENVVRLYPKNYEFRMVLASAYSMKGYFEEAREEAEEALLINPELKEVVEEFLGEVKAQELQRMPPTP